MRTVSYRLADLQKCMITIGFVGENEHTVVQFDCKKIYDEYPSAVPALTVQPPEGSAYPAVTTREGDTVSWTVEDSDLVYQGYGELQLTFSQNGVVVKSYIVRTRIERSIAASGQAPDPVEDWLTAANTALNAIPQTIDDALAEAKASGEFDGADGVSPVATVSKSGNTATITITDSSGTTTTTVTDGTDGQDGDDGVSPTATVSKVGSIATITITDANGTTTAEISDGADGDPGDDGYSPSASVSKVGNTATISITDKTGTTTAEISDGQDGDPGADGYSPTATVTKSGKVATITITDKNGTTSETVSDGDDADPTTLIDDTAGTGVTNKCWSADKLTSALNDKYTKPETGIPASDLASGVIPTVPVTDVQVNGTSVLSSGVANVQVGGFNKFGVFKLASGYSLNVSTEGFLFLDGASENQVKAGTTYYRPIMPERQHMATFYGLAKAAGDSTQSSSSNAVGTYTESALSAISGMLNAPVSVSGSTPSITAKSGVRYVCGECSTLSVTLPASGCVDVVFESGSTATVLTVTPPNGVTAIKWANGFDPSSLDANTRYEILIDNGEWGMACAWT